MEKTILLLMFLILSFTHSWGQNWEWATQYPDAANGRYSKIIIDNGNNLFSLGRYLPASIVKYNDQGDSLNSILLPGLHSDIGYHPALGILVSGTQSSGAYIARLDTALNVQWQIAEAFGNAMVIDVSQNFIYVSGSYNGMLVFDDDTLTATGWDNNFLAKFDAGGNCVLLRHIGTKMDISDMKTDDQGNCILTGNIRNSASIGPQSYLVTTYTDPFITKFDDQFNFEWANQISGGSLYSSPMYDGDKSNALCIGPSGNIYITGSITDTAYFGSVVLPGTLHTDDMFVAKYREDGTLIRVRRLGNITHESGRSIGSDSDENIYICGSHQLELFVDDIYVTSVGNCDVLTLRMDSTGIFNWGINAGSQVMDDWGLGCVLDLDRNIYVAGFFDDSISFGGTELFSQYGTDAFIAKIGANLTQINTPENFNGDLILYPSPAVDVFTLSAGENIIDHLEIVSLEGKLISAHKCGSSEATVRIGDLNNGYYLVRVYTGNRVLTKKVVKTAG